MPCGTILLGNMNLVPDKEARYGVVAPYLSYSTIRKGITFLTIYSCHLTLHSWWPYFRNFAEQKIQVPISFPWVMSSSPKNTLPVAWTPWDIETEYHAFPASDILPEVFQGFLLACFQTTSLATGKFKIDDLVNDGVVHCCWFCK